MFEYMQGKGTCPLTWQKRKTYLKEWETVFFSEDGTLKLFEEDEVKYKNYLIVINNTPVGVFSFGNIDENKSKLFIENNKKTITPHIWISSVHRGNGYAKKLYSELIEYVNFMTNFHSRDAGKLWSSLVDKNTTMAEKDIICCWKDNNPAYMDTSTLTAEEISHHKRYSYGNVVGYKFLNRNNSVSDRISQKFLFMKGRL